MASPFVTMHTPARRRVPGRRTARGSLRALPRVPTLFAGGPLDELQVGTDVTVVYDAADSRKHTLDVDHVRRADAALRRL